MSRSHDEIEKKIIQAIKFRFTQIETNFNLFYNNPYHSEYVHRLRVELRKIRALLHFLKPVIGQNKYKKMNKRFRSLGKMLSEIRDIDSLIEIVNQLAIEKPKLLKNYAWVFGFLEDQRLVQAHRVAAKDNLRKMSEEMGKARVELKTLKLTIKGISESNYEEFIRAQYIKKNEKLKKKVKNMHSKDYLSIHELRKESKKVRYAAVGFKSILPKKIRKPIKKDAKVLQEQLGEITDWYVNIEKLSEYKELTQNDALKDAFQTLIDDQLNRN